MCCIGFQDTTAIPLVFATVLGNDDSLSKTDNFKDKAIDTVLIYTVFVTIYKWTVAYKYQLFSLVKPLPIVEDSSPLNKSVFSNDSVIGNSEGSGFWWTFKKIMNPPIYATLISIPISLIPYMKEYVISGSGSVFGGNVYKALVVLGASVSPMINILLGCNLSRGYPPEADISW